jgi:hypothetical protein
MFQTTWQIYLGYRAARLDADAVWVPEGTAAVISLASFLIGFGAGVWSANAY